MCQPVLTISFSGPVPVNSTITALPRKNLLFITDQWLLPWLDFVKENRRIYKVIHAQMDVFGAERAYKQFFQAVFSPVLSRYGVAAEKHEYIMEFYRYGLAAVVLKWVESDCQESAAEIAEIIKMCIGNSADEKT